MILVNTRGEQLKQMRENLGLTQQDVANKLGFHRSVISNLEINSPAQTKNLNILENLAKFYDVPANELIVFFPKEMPSKNSTGQKKEKVTIELVDHKKIQAFLADLLKDGPVLAQTIYQAAKAEGFSHYNLTRAKRILKVNSFKDRDVTYGRWYWRLPKDDRLPEKIVDPVESKIDQGLDLATVTGIIDQRIERAFNSVKIEITGSGRLLSAENNEE
jgi:transcriptional regulator with XRE-family HTH domain|tara:strand:- start:5040 stop:5690 length:651 start_codon:yes stop_codon:yes gene_type:complete